MLKKLLIIFLSFLIHIPIVIGQIYLNSEEVNEPDFSDTTKFQFTRIEIIGNNKTRPEVILRELRFTENQIASFEEIIAAYKRVQSLLLFNRVKFDIVGDREYSILLVTVYEKWYIFPIPLIYRNERSWRKISYGGKLLYYNFLGRNILLNFTAAFGYNPIFKFSYYNPWFLGKLKLFTNISAYYGKVRSRSPELDDYEDTRKGFEWLIGKRFGHFTFTGISLGYTELTAPHDIGLTLSSNGKDYLPSAMLIFQYDDRDLKEYPHKGWFLTFWGKRVGNNHVINYYRYGTDIRSYVPLSPKLTFALRTAFDISSGKIPSYDRVYFGYLERLRGHYYEIFEGENLALGSAEIRFPLMKIRYINIETLPEFEEYSNNLKFGISAGIFFDSGVIWNQNESFRNQQVKTGFGAGIHFHIPYVDVFRLECGFNNRWRAEAIAEVEVAF